MYIKYMSIVYIDNEISQIENLYNRFLIPNFLADELKPLEIILKLYEEGYYKVISMLNDDETIAVAFLVSSKDKDSYLLDYFAVDMNNRSSGFGSSFLSYLKNEFGRNFPIIIETETINDSDNDRKRRQLFYVRNGAVITTFKALIFDCVYDIWYLSDSEFDNEYIIQKYEEIYKFMLGKEMYDNNCIIPYFSYE